MKKYYLVALLFLPIGLFAQKRVNLDQYSFTVQFRSLPKMRLDSTYRTYNVEVEGTKLMQHFLKELAPEKSVILEGWKKLDRDGHISIKVKLEDLLPQSVSIKERVENITDRSGKVTGTRTLYHEEMVYTFAAIANISDYKGLHIMDQVLANRNYSQVYNSPEFPIRQLAEGYFILNSINKTGDLYKNCVTRAMHYLSEQITDNFGFSEVTVKDYMWIIGNRKHPEYDDHRNAFHQLNDVFFSMNANQSIEEIREKTKPVIDYFESIKQNYSSKRKHDRKIRYASYFNLAVLYYYLDDPQAMMKEANGLLLNDYKTSVGKSFAASATRLKNQFQQANINTRHFKIDTNSFTGPYEKTTVTAK